MMRFWLDKGVDGFRMDVISLISKRFPLADVNIDHFNEVVDTTYANGPRIHEFLQEMYREVMGRYDVMTVGEGPGISRAVVNDYVGENRGELNMVFHFGHMFIDHGQGGKFDIQPASFSEFKQVFYDWDEAVGEEGWINIFLDNHDFPRMVSRWANDGEYRVPAAKLLAALILSMRGTPCIYQGSEIGMTNVAFDSIDDYDDVEAHNYYQEQAVGKDSQIQAEVLKRIQRCGRDNARTPIQWGDSPNGGFTTGEPWLKVNPRPSDVNDW